MELRELSMFVQAYESGSFAEAAARSFVTRQALSKTVAQLEARTGALFERNARGVRPTVLGEALYPHAKRIVEELAAIDGEVRRHAAGEAGSLVLALEASAALTLPRGLTSAYAAARPGVALKTMAFSGDAVGAALASGKAEAAVTGPLGEDGFSFEPIYASTLSVVFAARAFEGRADVLRDSALDGLRVSSALPDMPAAPPPAGETLPARPADDAASPPGCAARCAGGPRLLDVQALRGMVIFGVAPENYVERRLVPYLESRGIAARITYDRVDTALATSEMEAGLGGVIVESAGAAQKFWSDRYVHIPLRGADAPGWEVGVVYRAGSPCAPAARDFAAFARAYVARSAERRGGSAG